jgi:hypothetical protein
MSNLVKSFESIYVVHTKGWWIDGISKGAFDKLTLGGMLRIVPQQSKLARKDIDEIQHLMRRRYGKHHPEVAQSSKQLHLVPRTQPVAAMQQTAASHHYTPSTERHKPGYQPESYYYHKIEIHGTTVPETTKGAEKPWKNLYQMMQAIALSESLTDEEQIRLTEFAEVQHQFRFEDILRNSPTTMARLPEKLRNRPTPPPFVQPMVQTAPIVEVDLQQFARKAATACTELQEGNYNVDAHFRALAVASTVLGLAVKDKLSLKEARDTIDIMVEALKPSLRNNSFARKG